MNMLLERIRQRVAFWLKVENSEQVTQVDLIMIFKLLHDVNQNRDASCRVTRNKIRHYLEQDIVETVKKQKKMTMKTRKGNHRILKSNTTTTKIPDSRFPPLNLHVKKESIHLRTELYIVDNGSEDSDTDMENKLGQTVRNMKVSGRTTKLMDVESSTMLMEMSSMASGRTIKPTALALTIT